MKRNGIETMITTEKGFSIIELMVVLSIVMILAAIGGLVMNSWLGKARVEAQINQMYSDLVNARILALNRNRMHFVVMTPNSYQIWEDTNPGPDGDGVLTPADTQRSQVNLKDTLLSAATYTLFNFDNKGLISGTGTILIQNNFGAIYDCVAVSATRIRMGRWNGASCL